MGLIQSAHTRIKSYFGSQQQGVGQIKPIKIGHTWTIANFRNYCDKVLLGEEIVSPVFSTGDNNCYKWRLILNPRGEDKGEYVSLYLQMVTSDQSLILKSKFSLSVINNNGEYVNKCWALQEQCCFVGDKTIWGFKQFFKLGELLEVRNNKFLQGKCKKAQLVIFVTNECEETSVIPQQCELLKISVTENILEASKDFKRLLQNGKLSDVAIISNDGREFRAHKVILAARSPVFAAMFEHDMREKNSNIVVVDDIRGEIMREVLSYIYSGTVNNLESNGYYQELLATAEKYALNGLKYMCEQFLINLVTPDTAFELLILSDMYNATNLRNQMKQFIIDQSKEIVQAPSFKTLKTTHPELIAEIFEKMVLENDFFDACDCTDDCTCEDRRC